MMWGSGWVRRSPPVLALVCLLSVGGGFAAAQESVNTPEARDRGTVGFFLGQTSSRQLWGGNLATDRLNGLSLGIFVDVQTPVPALLVRAELGYAGRGTIVWDLEEDPERAQEARVKVHYISFPVHGMVELRLGPVVGYVFAGPTVDVLVASDCSMEFCPGMGEEKGAVVNAAGGIALGFDLPREIRARFELRFTEGLGDAYLGGIVSARNRSAEMLVRLGRPF